MTSESRTVLVVEDHDDTRDMMCEALRGIGYATAGVASTAAARVAAATVRPDVILVEPALRGASGREVLRDIVELGPPVVVLTSSTNELLHRAAYQAGCRAVIVKPAEFTTIELAIRVALSAHRS